MTLSPYPTHAQILIVGGGPAGSYAASALAREGLDVVLFEAAKFPRYHIGESMLPSLRPFLCFIDAEESVRNHGFCVKPGAAFKMAQCKREGYTDFVSLDPNNGSWNVIRSEFDDLMLNHAAKSGARVFQETRVTEIHFKSPTSKQPISATYRSASGYEAQITFDYLIDASGRNGIMSTKYLKNRHYNQSLNNVACWGYWTGCKSYMPGTSRENAIWVEALNDESGWAWFIPLHNGTTSVGIVMDTEVSKRKKAAARETFGKSQSMLDHYLEELHHAPGLYDLLGDGELKNRGKTDAIKAASDFSYSATEYAGPHFRLAGDAGAFIDPFFSSGIHLAFTGGLAAAVSVAASIRGSVSEEKACQWHTAKIGTAYTRFLLVVLGTYTQMRSQSKPIMSDIDEDNFDRAFALIRPVIQGTADVGKTLSEDELVQTMDFCRHIFAPTTPEMHEAVAQRVGSELMRPDGKVMREEDLKEVVDSEDVEAMIVLCEVNARKAIHPVYDATRNFGEESHVGLNALIEKGRLGLVEV